MDFDLSNPIVLIIAGILFLAILYFWNKRNAGDRRERRNRDFHRGSQNRRKEREKGGGKDEGRTDDAQQAEWPRSGNPTRIRNRCALIGRAQGY